MLRMLMVNDNPTCVICGKPFTDHDPGIPILGWALDIIGTKGFAHYLCVSQLANETSYLRGIAPWDIGQPHPALVDLVEQKKLPLGSVFEPGPGRGDNALYLASKGYDVTTSDISPSAVEALRRRARDLGLSLNVIQAEVIYGLNSLTGKFDIVFERSFLQTLPPLMRSRYIDRVALLLHEGGIYVGIIRGPRDPPPVTQPYAFTKQEILELFAPRFDIIEVAPTVSGHDDNELTFWLVQARLKT
ncbi:MAG: TPMT family class I SAM-dependent methyltransferase [Candidatus Thorarchaeota archaeon]|nr:TPMT family class I SAM-dependent methyltransferase [Candidatus Thorarchaeota archaeon]